MNKFIEKLAEREVGRHDASNEPHNLPHKEERLKISPSKQGVARRRVAGALGLGLMGVAGYQAYKGLHHKQADILQPEEQHQHIKDLANTGVMGAMGAGTAALTHHVLQPKSSIEILGRGKSGTGKAALIGGALGLVGDYAGVKLNNAMNKYLDKAANIALNPANKGLLHKKMGVPEGKKISNSSLEAKKESAQKSGNVKLEREAQFAINAKKWHHKSAESYAVNTDEGATHLSRDEHDQYRHALSNARSPMSGLAHAASNGILGYLGGGMAGRMLSHRGGKLESLGALGGAIYGVHSGFKTQHDYERNEALRKATSKKD